MREWKIKRAIHLRHITSLKGLPANFPHCSSRQKNGAIWRCRNCLGQDVLCKACCIKKHQSLPFHRVESWNGSFFEVGALWQTGLKLHLGHNGSRCPLATEG